MAAVSSRLFWESFFLSQQRVEWYFSLQEVLPNILSLLENTSKTEEQPGDGKCIKMDNKISSKAFEALAPNTRIITPKVVLHAGSGNALLQNSDMFKKLGYYCMEFDFSASAFQCGIEDSSKQHDNVLVADALEMPFRNEVFDLIIEKGLFDSITGTSKCAVERAYSLLCEYHRCLSPQGYVVIFSIFGPCSEEKDMLGLLYHPDFNVECQSLYVSPAELPSQDFCFVYLLSKVSR